MGEMARAAGDAENMPEPPRCHRGEEMRIVQGSKGRARARGKKKKIALAIADVAW